MHSDGDYSYIEGSERFYWWLLFALGGLSVFLAGSFFGAWLVLARLEPLLSHCVPPVGLGP